MTSLLQTVRLICLSNAFFNPVVYALRIPEFREGMGLCCFRRKASMNEEDHKRIDNSTAALVSNTELRTLRLDPSQLQLACEQDVFDTKF